MSDQRRSKVAAGRVAGKTAREIAQETGLAAKTVERQANDPRTVTLIQRLKQRDGAQLERMWKSALDTMERDMKSKDNAVCAAARTQFLRLLPLGDPPPVAVAPSDNSAGTITLEELLATYHQVTNG